MNQLSAGHLGASVRPPPTPASTGQPSLVPPLPAAEPRTGEQSPPSARRAPRWLPSAVLPVGRRRSGAVPGPGAPDGGGGDGDGGSRSPRRPDEARPGRLDLRNTWQVVAGSLLVPAGVVLVMVAWYGAAHARFVQQQVPYLVSGSFVGLGCMVLGGLLYWAHWLYRLYDQADLHHQEAMRVLQATIKALAEGPATTGPGHHVPTSGPEPSIASWSPPDRDARMVTGTPSPTNDGPWTTAAVPGEASYVATAAGTVYHRLGCPVVAHHGQGLRHLVATDLSGMDPCRICTPRN